MNNHWIFRLLERFCDDVLWEGISGDLEELYDYEVAVLGPEKAAKKMRWRAVGFFRPAFYRKQTQLKNSIEAMFRNNLIITLRSFKKHKAYTFINIFGLATGMAAGFLILQYVTYELSYDNFFENKENIYRIRLDRFNNGELGSQWAAGCAGIGPAIYDDFPEVSKFTKLHSSQSNITYNREFFKIENGYFADSSFFEIFSIPLVSGIDSLVLRDPYTTVLSQSLAKKIFGDQNPIGKEIKLGDQHDMLVTGVFEDLPDNSHMAFDVLYSFETFVDLTDPSAHTNWYWDGYLTYIKLMPGSDPAALESKLPNWVIQREGDELEKFNEGMTFYLQPLEQIHLISDFRGEIKPTGNKTANYFLGVTGVFVLIIAWINYINLTTARSLQRAKEVGIRKTLGSFRSQLMGQFLFESTFMNLIALAAASLAVLYFFPQFNAFAGRSNAYTWPDLPAFWFGFGALVFMGTLLSGFYPALVLSGFKPLAVLRGSFSRSKSGNNLRRGLVIFQFFASIILITGTFIVYKQMAFMRNQSLGVEINETLVLEAPRIESDSVYASRFGVFKNLLQQESFVRDITQSNSVPGGTPGWNAGGIRLLSQGEDQSQQFRVIGQDDNFIDFYGLELIAGRGFDRSYSTEESNVIFSEKAVNLIGLADPEEILNKKIQFWGDTFNVVGVVKNYRQESPKSDYDALIFRYFENPNGFYSVDVSSNNMQQVIRTVEQHWQTAYDNQIFEFFFLDDHYNEQYKSEVRFGSIFGLFSGLAIFIACLGLFGLASYMTSLRTKEVSIRKVLGADQKNLWLLLTTDFLKLVGISIIASVPLTYYLMGEWLENFATRIDLNIWLFVAPAVILIAIALLTVSYHVLRVIFTNPAQSLKYE